MSPYRTDMLILLYLYLGLPIQTDQGAQAEKRSDPVNYGSADGGAGHNLEALLQQQAATIQSLQARLVAMETSLEQQGQIVTQQQSRLQNVTTELQIVTDKIAQQEHSVGFYVDFGQEPIGEVMAAATPNDWVNFNRVLTNVGDGYNDSVGVFTAPCDGLYTFSLHLMAGQHGDVTNLAILAGNTTLGVAYAEGSARHGNNQGSCTVVVHLAEGEEVGVRAVYGNPAIWGSVLSSFSGMLVKADS